ncbi:hypothetical protein GCM10010978_17540 [Compostibacillus humi]|uniref:Globin-sensor domain-containing protein n=1 Tax=Compostibacillus humi TaxID=1245525 RepID=A0A8J2TLB5_9BACI|nr:protoglobin domain-containing protein [Compostibacillus humi]GFZ76346.1 hypothetical protein GCM10010978_17540 [Compostibacillus humi]
MAQLVTQETINELVERFYDKLTKKPYFIHLFSEKNVDVERLKERQRQFLAKLANTASENEDTDRVNKSHPFHVRKEGAQIWMETMIETIQEVDFAEDAKQSLIEKIRELLNSLLNRNEDSQN